MRRFFCNPQSIKNDTITITDTKELHHMIDVVRLELNERVTILDGQGGKYFCKIAAIEKKKITLEIFDRFQYAQADVQTKLTVACAWLTKDKMNFVVEKLTELAVERIILIETERGKVRPKTATQRIEKLKSLARETMKQSATLFVPVIEHMKFSRLLSQVKDFDIALLPNLEEGSAPIRAVLSTFLKGNILVAIGPEGDFSPREVAQAKQTGFISVTLGDTILKVETAAIVVAGFVRLRTLLLGKEA